MLYWVLFDSGHRADDSSSLVRAIRDGPEIGAVRDLETRSERRCSGPAWWVRWKEIARAPIGKLDHQELVFENRGREALIAYSRQTVAPSDKKLLASMVAYCAGFNV